MAATGDYLINFRTNVAPIEQAMAGLGGTAESTLARIRTLAAQPVSIPVNVRLADNNLGEIIGRAGALGNDDFTKGGRVRADVKAALDAQLVGEVNRLSSSEGITGPRGGLGTAKVQEERRLAILEAARQQQARFIQEREQLFGLEKQIDARRLATGVAALAAENEELVGLNQKSNAQRAAATIERQKATIDAQIARLGSEDYRLKLEELSRQKGINSALASRARQEARLAQEQALLRSSPRRVDRLASGGGFGGGLFGPASRAGGLGGFFGGGLASTLRFAVPGALLFGAVSGISKTVKEAEELEQIFVRLESQFQSLGSRGLFGGSNPAEQARLAAEGLETYREELFSIARETGLATDETAELGQKFIGLFSSIEGAGSAQELAEQATRITAEFSIISGLDPEETFNDLAGAVRSFGETGREVLTLIDDLTDSVINVSDATGVSAGEITDFVGRIGPAAAQAGLELNEIIALGATALQGSGVGGAALAEQFARVLTGLQGELGIELSRLAIQFEEVFQDIDIGDGVNVGDLFNLENINDGNVDQILIGLINGFDELTESQQRQIIASVGSRREGATLAAVLQNAATFTTALDAATNAAGERQERFADIISRLTGQLTRLSAEFTQLGLSLFEAGLADVLSALIAGLGTFVDVLGLAATVLVEFGSVLGSIIPEGAGRSVAQLAVLVGIFRLIGRLAGDRLAFGLFSVAGGFDRTTAAATRASRAIALTAVSLRSATTASEAFAVAQTAASGALLRGAGLLGRAATAIGPLNLALGAGFLLWSQYSDAQEEANQKAEAARTRQESLQTVLSASNDQFDRAAAAAQAYADSLNNVANASGDGDGTGGGGPLSSGLSAALGQLEGDTSGALAAFADAAREAGLTLEEGLIEVLNSDLDISGIRDSVDDLDLDNDPIPFLSDAVDALDLDSDDAFRRRLAREALDALSENEEAPALIRELATQARSSLSPGDREAAFTALADLIEGENERRAGSEEQALEKLIDAYLQGDQRVTSVFSSTEEIRAEINRRAPDSEGPAGELFLALGFDLEQKQVESVIQLRESFDLVKEKYEAGLISQSEFFDQASQESADLRQILDAQLSGSDSARESAADTVKALREIDELVAELVVGKVDSTIEVAELIGAPLEGQDLIDTLLTAANDARVRRDSEAFSGVVTQIVEAEQQVALDAIDRAESLEAAQAIAATFSLSSEASAVFTRIQLGNSEQVNNVATLVGVAQSDLPAFLDGITESVELTGDLEGIIREVLTAELARLESILRTVGRGNVPDDIFADIAAIEAELANLDVSNVRTGADVGINPDLSELDTAAKIAQEQVIAEYEELEKIFSATGQDQDLGSRVARLVQTLDDPDVVAGTEEAIELSLTLAELIREAQDLTGAELDAFNEAVVGLIGTAGQTTEQFGAANVLFQLLSDSANGFNSFLSTYVQTGSTVFNGMLSQISALVAAGVGSAEAVKQARDTSLVQLRRQLAAAESAFGSNPNQLTAAVFRAARAQVEALEELEGQAGFDEAVTSIPRVSIPSVGAGSGGSGGGSSRDSNPLKAAVEYAIALQEAQFDLLEAQIGNDEIALAELELERADFALATAIGEVERIEAMAQQVRAQRGYWEAIANHAAAQNDLAIAIAESMGDFDLAFELAVIAAQTQLDFLRNSGAGAAEIAGAQLELLNAQTAQERGLVQADLDELGFLFNIGDLTQDAYIAALKKILQNLDPVADVDLWRQISLQIKGLEDSSRELQFNLPDTFDLPTLYQVRRLDQVNAAAQAGFGGGAASTNPSNFQPSFLSGQGTNITINVQTGMDWEEAKEVLREAMGVDQRVFSLQTKTY